MLVVEALSSMQVANGLLPENSELVLSCLNFVLTSRSLPELLHFFVSFCGFGSVTESSSFTRFVLIL